MQAQKWLAFKMSYLMLVIGGVLPDENKGFNELQVNYAN
jgi:hypothetical protein